ncbi:putative quinol monooxygenase [Nocardiopsis kunsanensis]|nr:antibiotic biosynthesis monooxygenase [Nocardiopsis kunsanensis]
MVTVGLAFISALVGWSGTAALAAYAQRRPGVASVAWLIAALGMTVGLSAAVIGAMFDFGELTFRLLQTGLGLIGPLYMAWGAFEFTARASTARFASRLLLSAFTVVPLVVFGVDRLSGQFGSTFPAFADHYDLIPRVLAGLVHGFAAVLLAAALTMAARRAPITRNTGLTVVALVTLSVLLSVVVSRFGLGALGPLLMLGAVSALWGAAALAVDPRRNDHDDDDDYYYDDEYDHADEDDFEDLPEEPVRRKRRNADTYDDLYDAPPRRSQGSNARSVITIYTIADGQVPAFDQLAGAVVSEVSRNEPDTLLFAAHTVASAPQQRIVYAIYRDELAREEHEQQPHVLEFQRRSAGVVVATNVIELSLSEASASDGLATMLMPR